MSRQQKQLQSRLAKLAGAMTALSAVVLVLGVSQVERALQECLSVVVGLTWAALPSMALSGWRALQSVHLCGASPLVEGVLRISESCWRVIACVMAGL
jgi:hypothetical protein